MQIKLKVSQTTPAQRQPHTWCPFTIVPFHHRLFLPSRSALFFILRPIERARRRPGKCKGAAQGIATRRFAGRHPFVTHVSRVVTLVLMPPTANSESTSCHNSIMAQCAATTAEYTLCAPPFLRRRISLQFPDCLRNERECNE